MESRKAPLHCEHASMKVAFRKSGDLRRGIRLVGCIGPPCKANVSSRLSDLASSASAAAAAIAITAAAFASMSSPHQCISDDQILLPPIDQKPFSASADLYKGKIIKIEDVASCPDALNFSNRLKATVDAFRKEGCRGVWLSLPAAQTAFLPLALAQGFELHHADKGQVTVTYWIPSEQGEESTLPIHASHTLGVGALVLNRSGQILAVQEKSGPAAARRNFWKIPTGLVDPGEDACDAVVREVSRFFLKDFVKNELTFTTRQFDHTHLTQKD